MQKLQNDLIKKIWESTSTMCDIVNDLDDIADKLDDIRYDIRDEQVSEPEPEKKTTGIYTSNIGQKYLISDDAGNMSIIPLYKDLETTLIAGLLIDSSKFEEISKIVNVCCFKKFMNRFVYRTMFDLHITKKSIIFLNIYNNLNNRCQMSYVENLLSSVNSTVIPHLIEIAHAVKDMCDEENETEKKVTDNTLCPKLVPISNTLIAESIGDPIFDLDQFNRDKLYCHKRQIDGMTIYKDLETTLLGALMIDSSNFGDVSKIVCDNDFKNELNREIYYIMRKLYENGKPIDSLNIKEEIASKGMMNLEKHIYIFNIAFNSPIKSIKHIISLANIISLENIISFEPVSLNIMPESTEYSVSCSSLRSETTETDKTEETGYETMLLGALLRSFTNLEFENIVKIVNIECFSSWEYKCIFKTIKDLYNNNMQVNILNVKSKLFWNRSYFVDQIMERTDNGCYDDIVSLAKIVKAKSDLREATDAIKI